MQLTLGFLDQWKPPVVPWEELDNDARREFVGKLAQLIARTILRDENEEQGASDD